MQLSKIISFSLILLSRVVFSQNLDTTVLSKKINYEGEIDLKPNCQLFIDSLGKIPFQYIQKQNFKPLHLFKFPPLFNDYHQYTFWLKVSIKNPTDTIINVLFTTGVHKSIDVFRISENSLQKLQSTNQTLRPNERPYKFDEQFIPLSFCPNQTYDLLIKVNEHPQIYFKLTPKIVSYAAEYETKIKAFDEEYGYLLHDGIYLSILTFATIYMFIMYFVEQKRYYLYYGLYIFFLAIFGFWAIEHSPYIHFIFSYIPVLKFSGNNNTYLLLTNIFYYLFHSEFLELQQNAPKFNRVLHGFVKFLVILLIIDTFVNFILTNYSLGGKIWLISQPIIAIFGIYITYQLYQLKGPFVRYIQIGSTVLLIGAIVGFLEQLLLIKPDNIVLMRLAPSFVLNYAVLIEIFCFSTALGYKTWLTQRLRNQLIRSVKESELRTLRSQINPHFIFNSLNSIKSYILRDRKLEASEYLTDFSTLMRAILQQSKDKFISLAAELETTLLYIKLENLRFEGGFLFDYQIDETLNIDDILIPPMLLQPYIENAIKHGLMSKAENRVLTLKIERKNSEEIYIKIDDNGIGRERAGIQQKNTINHESMSTTINDERIQLLGLTTDLHINIEIVDKKTPQGISEGTTVIITLPI